MPKGNKPSPRQIPKMAKHIQPAQGPQVKRGPGRPRKNPESANEQQPVQRTLKSYRVKFKLAFNLAKDDVDENDPVWAKMSALLMEAYVTGK